MKRTYTLLEQGVYTTEVFLMRSKEITQELETKRRKKQEAENAIEEHARQLAARDDFIPTVRHVIEVYDTMSTPADKNALLRGNRGSGLTKIGDVGVGALKSGKKAC